MKDKKGIGRLAIWFFYYIVLTIIVLTIVVVVSSFYSNQYDTRQVEANLIANRLVKCITNNGVIEKTELDSMFTKPCSIKLNTEDYYAEATYLWEGKEEKVSFGKSSLGNLCGLKDKIKITYAPSCNKLRYYSLIKGKEGVIPSRMDLLVVISKTEKNV